ncbi:MAG: hypothetical protein ACTSO9_03975 [Candidatus Helarchaeota archaeon]
MWLKWDDCKGVILDWKYPETLNFSQREINIIYVCQLAGNIITPRFTIFSSNDLRLASYYGGEINKDMIVLLLEKGEDPEFFKRILINFYYEIIHGKIERSSFESKFEVMLFKLEDLEQKNKERFDSIEYKLELYLEEYKNILLAIDDRAKKYENNVIYVIQNIISNNLGSIKEIKPNRLLYDYISDKINSLAMGIINYGHIVADTLKKYKELDLQSKPLYFIYEIIKCGEKISKIIDSLNIAT